MILAAGLGTRLRPLTDNRPKALVEIAGHTLLELTLLRLKSCGIVDVIINIHHFADQVSRYLAANRNFDMRLEISREEILLDTGGGLKQAAHFLTSGGSLGEPFLLHNVDVLSNIDFEAMLREHRDREALATLAVQDRPTSRYLLFDEQDLLCGRQTGNEGPPELIREAHELRARAFSGVHIISPRIFDLMQEEGVFSIIPVYLRLASDGENIAAFSADKYYWRDLGRPEQIVAASRDIQSGFHLPA